MSYTMICAIFNILGIYLGSKLSFMYMLCCTLSGLFITLLVGAFRKRINLPLITALIMLSVGCIAYNLASYNRLYEMFPEETVTVTGTIVSSPAKSSGKYINKYVFQPHSVT